MHKADLISFLLDRRFTGVEAVLTTLDKTGHDGSPIQVEDNAICIFRMEGGVTGTMTVSWTYYGQEDNSTIIYGSEGILRIYDDPAHAIRLIKKDGGIEDFDVEQIQTNDNQTRSGIADAFITALVSRDGGVLDAERILPSMKAVFAAVRSHEEGRFIDIM